MSDNLKRYCAIKKALESLRPTELKGNQARHLDTLAMLVAGVIGAKKCYLPDIAQKVPLQAKPTSTVRRMERFLDNDAIDTKKYYLPFAVQNLLDALLGRSQRHPFRGRQRSRGRFSDNGLRGGRRHIARQRRRQRITGKQQSFGADRLQMPGGEIKKSGAQARRIRPCFRGRIVPIDSAMMWLDVV